MIFQCNTSNNWNTFEITQRSWLPIFDIYIYHIDGLVQGRRNSSALAMELRLSCNNVYIYFYIYMLIYSMLYVIWQQIV